MAIELYCLDVGQGQCIALIGPSSEGLQAAIIDVGIAGLRLATWLKRIGVKHISLIVLTHNHKDHINGLTLLVEAFAPRVGDVRFVIDKADERIPYWMPVQEWVVAGKIGSADVVYAPETSTPGKGRKLLERQFDGFSLYCIYPTVFEAGAVAREAPLHGIHPGRNENAASAITRLAHESNPGRTIALFGGDLTFQGWHRLEEKGYDLSAKVVVVPHHGTNVGADENHGPEHFARAVQPDYALISVGIGNSYEHPRLEMIKALRRADSTVLCTQITERCAVRPEAIPGGAVRSPIPKEPRLTKSGVACAGNIVMIVSEAEPPEIVGLSQHQDAVDRLPRAPICPMCRAIENQ